MKKTLILTVMALAFASVSYAGTVTEFPDRTIAFNYTSEDLRTMFPQYAAEIGEHQYQVLSPQNRAYMTIFLHGSAVIEGYMLQGWEECVYGLPLGDGTQVYSWPASVIDGVHHAHLTVTTCGNWYGLLIDPWGNAVRWYFSIGGVSWTDGPILAPWDPTEFPTY